MGPSSSTHILLTASVSVAFSYKVLLPYHLHQDDNVIVVNFLSHILVTCKFSPSSSQSAEAQVINAILRKNLHQVLHVLMNYAALGGSSSSYLADLDLVLSYSYPI